MNFFFTWNVWLPRRKRKHTLLHQAKYMMYKGPWRLKTFSDLPWVKTGMGMGPQAL